MCESTLLPWAPAVGADRASNWSSYMMRGSRGGAMNDCAVLASSAEEELRQSAPEMERMGRAGSPRFEWHMDNVLTWVSAALTDTCLDSLGNVRVAAVAQATTNALRLVSKLDPAPAPPSSPLVATKE